MQTSYLDKTTKIVRSNFDRTKEFIATLGAPACIEDEGKGIHLWKDISANKVAGFLDGFVVNRAAVKAQGDKLSEYIRKQENQSSELGNWTVALISTTTAANRLQSELGEGLDIGLPIRAPQPAIDSNKKLIYPPREDDPSVYCLRQRNIITPTHNWLDLKGVILSDDYIEALLRKACFGGASEHDKKMAKEERDIIKAHKGELVAELGWALTRHRANKKKPGSGDNIKKDDLNGRVMRALRLQTNGLLLLYPLDPKGKQDNNSVPLTDIHPDIKAIMGFAISFPVAEKAIPIDYDVNKVFLGSEDDIDGEDDFDGSGG